MPETPEQLHERAAAALRMPPVEEWDTFPFDGEMRPRALRPPTPTDPAREGEGNVDCPRCAAPDEACLWTNLRWRLFAHSPNGLPVVVLLEPRQHYAEPGDLPEDLAAEFGVLVGRIERAVRAVPGVGRVHVCRWGDGGEHLHWWFMARPARFPSCSAASPRSGTTSSRLPRTMYGTKTSDAWSINCPGSRSTGPPRSRCRALRDNTPRAASGTRHGDHRAGGRRVRRVVPRARRREPGRHHRRSSAQPGRGSFPVHGVGPA